MLLHRPLCALALTLALALVAGACQGKKGHDGGSISPSIHVPAGQETVVTGELPPIAALPSQEGVLGVVRLKVNRQTRAVRLASITPPRTAAQQGDIVDLDMGGVT